MKFGIIGSRTFNDYDILTQVLEKFTKPSSIVSGGAKGADSLAKKYANKNGINIIEHKPDWSIGRHAGLLRNTKIIDDSDIIIAFWDGSSKGTQDSINKAKKVASSETNFIIDNIHVYVLKK